jgi:hypothetical protein
MSYVTLLIPATSFVMRDDTRRSTSGGKTNLQKGRRGSVKTSMEGTHQSAVMKSSVCTARSATT